jgi:hypothetical protein
MQKLDSKFDGVIFKVKNGTIVPPDQYMVFLAKDDAFPATLSFYYKECERLGAPDKQLEAVAAALKRVLTWRAENRDLCKIPDVLTNERLFKG